MEDVFRCENFLIKMSSEVFGLGYDFRIRNNLYYVAMYSYIKYTLMEDGNLVSEKHLLEELSGKNIITG